MEKLSVSLVGLPSAAPFGVLLQTFSVLLPAGKVNVPICSGTETAFVPSGEVGVNTKFGCATLFTLQPMVAEFRFAVPKFLTVTLTGSGAPGVTGDTGEVILVKPASFTGVS